VVERWVSFTNFSLVEQARARVSRTLRNGIQPNMSTEESKKLLRRHVNSKTNLAIMFVDINNSTQMSLTLAENKFALLVQSLSQCVYDVLLSSAKNKHYIGNFLDVNLDPIKWKYLSRLDPESMYRVYAYLFN